MGEYEGRVRRIVKDFPLPSHQLSHGAHEAARCAGVQGRYWAYHDRLFAAQPNFERMQLLQYAAEIGLDTVRFTRCLDGHSFAAAVDADVAQGKALGVRGTPSFFINGRPLVGAHAVETFRALIEDALKPER